MTAVSTSELAPSSFRRGGHPTWHQRRRLAMVRRLVAGLDAGGNAIDYGCGWGDITAAVAPAFERIVGYDLSSDRVAFANEQHPELEFRRCGTDGLPEVASASIDTVLSIVVLPFIDEPGKYLRECVRILRPGGTVIVTIPNPDSFYQSLGRLVGRSPFYNRRIGKLSEFRTRFATIGLEEEATDWFYDPPFDKVTNLGELALTGYDTIGHLLRIGSRASYLGFRLRRISGNS